MIRRLYVDNFRSLVDFTWEPGNETLVLGYNGSGKTTALDAIDVIRSWAHGWDRLENLVSSDRLTRWSDSETTHFELDLATSEGLFRYEVEFECPRHRGVPQVRKEELHLDGGIVFVRTDEGVIAFRGTTIPSANFPLPRSQSAVSSLVASENPELVSAFLAALSRVVVVSPMPAMMDGEAGGPESRPKYRFENFIAFYWSQTQNGKFAQASLGLLNEVWPEFDYLQLEPLGRKLAMSVVFKAPQTNGEFKLDFTDLSDGERMLIALYALLAYQRATPATSIIIDEPDNFVAIAELQPWLLKMLEDRPDDGQIILVSHNSEIIQTMGEERVAYFSRKDHLSPTKVSGLPSDETGLSLSERLARGWVDA